MQNLVDTISKVHEFKELLVDSNGASYMDVIRDLIKFDPFDGHKFYIFSIIKLRDKQRFNQPRLTKPEPIPGGTLIRVDPKNPDEMKLCWTLPSQEYFGLYKYKKLFADQFVYECIQTYKKNPKHLMQPEKDDVSEEMARDLYAGLKQRINRMKKTEKTKSSSSFEAVSSSSSDFVIDKLQ